MLYETELLGLRLGRREKQAALGQRKAEHESTAKPSRIVESINETTRKGWLVLKRP